MRTRIISLLALSAVLLSTAIKGPAQSKTGGEFPSCTDSLTSLAVPDGPHGLFAIIFPNVKLQEKAEHFLLHNPVVCGANLYLIWNEIDRGRGANPRYDFSKVEEQMKPWIKAGKQVNLVSWATGYGGRRRLTPDYVFKQVQT